MELAIPIIAMGGLYMISRQDNDNNNRQNEQEEEGFVGYSDLPNTNLPNENFPSERPMETPELSNTESLTHNNQYEGDAYTDKYFGKKGLVVESNPVTNTQKFTSLAGESVNNDYFQHNNMVPFFGRKKTTPNFDANQNEGIMDNYLGKGSQHIEKKEQAPLFAPNENYQWAYGTPNQSEFMQSRVNTVNKMANVLPFEQETVAPGIGLGYGTEGSNGFNSGMMNREAWMPKSPKMLIPFATHSQDVDIRNLLTTKANPRGIPTVGFIVSTPGLMVSPTSGTANPHFPFFVCSCAYP